MRTIFTLMISVQLAILISGCAKLMGNMRRDLDDGEQEYSAPVIGGRWAERGFLAESMPEAGSNDEYYAAVGHSERGPASTGYGDGISGRSWVAERYDESRRDLYRENGHQEDGMVSSSNTPNLDPPVKRIYKNGSRATRSDFIDESQNEGSLWAPDGQTNYFFTKNKVRGMGDIVTITIEADLIRDIGLEVRRTLTPREKENELMIAQEKIRAKILGKDSEKKDGNDSLATSSSAPSREPAADKKKGNTGPNTSFEDEPAIPTATLVDVDIAKALELKPNDTMMAEIIERYPNGNYKVRGTKKVLYKNGYPRLVTLVGVARGQDISEEDLVTSGKLYEYRLEAIR
ncbi:MAG: hypothetical protein A2428_01510 [Bdellovibrionales bacterium RIFOXYC1_FULL_54_43]|nr:MAG: hypothetical protein A2428_01510 [Bdellovibrionales bacterium RIFOXYC1_FULL_54_43]OFZ81064.1 MAG: hypothetical protein A2603_06000 [Bdellovibrionales bacterium RIFOXYD1_FULL_55_31]